MLLSLLGATDCEWLRRLFFAFAEERWTGRILSKYHTIFLRWNSIVAVAPTRDLMWTVQGVGRQHLFLEHLPHIHDCASPLHEMKIFQPSTSYVYTRKRPLQPHLAHSNSGYRMCPRPSNASSIVSCAVLTSAVPTLTTFLSPARMKKSTCDTWKRFSGG